MTTASTFRDLHAPGSLLVLPNAWDAASARLVEACGARAVATTSTGVAWSQGYADGNVMPPSVVAAAVAAIARVVHIPVSADVEAGYSSDPDAVGSLVARVIDAGAVGINLEDGSEPPDLLCAKIEAAKRAAARGGVDLFVNARTDVFLRGLVASDRAVGETVERARRYRGAGADGVFVPGLVAVDDIRAVATAVEPMPVNVMAWPGLPGVAELAALGVRRLSAGAAIASRAFGLARQLTTTFLASGGGTALFEGAVGYAEMNALLKRDG
jgi:2-methylisocitrate lyase-like PEP mutase family enzyme